MKNRDIRGRVSKFLRRNGVYLALAVSILTVSAVVIAGLTQRLSRDDSADSLNAQQQVEQKVTGQKDTRTSATKSTTVPMVTATTTAEEAPHLYLLPLSNTVQKAYSSDGPVYNETMKDWRLHLGVDFAGIEGQEVKAVTKGQVVAIRNDPMWGGIVEIDHGVGVITRYCGVKPIVQIGDVVEMGEHIGDLQTIPCECAQSAHLHLEMLVDGTPIDPVAAIALEVRYAETIE